MLDVLIVDDEPAALRSLRGLIPWEQYGFRIGGEAANGEEAYRLFLEHSHDVILTDIRMPRMDGLELIANVRRRSAVPIIVLSGYGEFEYARRAMQLGVKDYLLKPVSACELTEKLEAIKRQIEAEALERRKWYRGLPLAREQLVRRWARGLAVDPAALSEFHQEVREDAGPFRVLVLELPELQGGPCGTGHQLKRFAVRNVVEELIAGTGLLFEESPDRFGIVHIGAGRESDSDALMAYARKLRTETAKYAKTDICVAVGPSARSFPDVPASYESALELLNNKRLLPPGEPVWLAERVRRGSDSCYLLVEEVKQIVKERYGTNLGLKQIAAELFVNANQLGQLFHAYTGVPFKKYLLHTRIEAAKDMLVYTDKNVYEIAERAGFQELDWFYKKFREVTGKSATQYRMEKLSESVKPTKEDRQCDSELAIIPSTGRKSDGRGMSN